MKYKLKHKNENEYREHDDIYLQPNGKLIWIRYVGSEVWFTDVTGDYDIQISPWTTIDPEDARTLPEKPEEQWGVYILAISGNKLNPPELHWLSNHCNIKKYIQSRRIIAWMPIPEYHKPYKQINKFSVTDGKVAAVNDKEIE